MDHSDGTVTVGRVTIDVELATQWVAEYTNEDENSTSNAPFAFPAYDHFDAGCSEGSSLTDGDLMAPGLLNVPVSIRVFYGLQRIRKGLELALAEPLLTLNLDDLSDEDINRAIAPLYTPIDVDAPWGVQGTTLSKVLHRKRPSSVVLHDRWVRKCYIDTDRLPVKKGRRWSQYMVGLTCAIRDDIKTQTVQFETLQRASAGAATLTPVRLLDILAWRSQGVSPS